MAGLFRRASRLGLAEAPYVLDIKVEELVLDTTEDVFRTMSFGLMRGSKGGSTKPRLIVNHHSRWGDRIRMPVTLFRDASGQWQEKEYRLELRQSVSPTVRFSLATFTIDATQYARDASEGERCTHFQRVDLYAPQLRGLDGTATVRLYIRCCAADAIADQEASEGEAEDSDPTAAETGKKVGDKSMTISPQSAATSPVTSFFSPMNRSDQSQAVDDFGGSGEVESLAGSAAPDSGSGEISFAGAGKGKGPRAGGVGHYHTRLAGNNSGARRGLLNHGWGATAAEKEAAQAAEAEEDAATGDQALSDFSQRSTPPATAFNGEEGDGGGGGFPGGPVSTVGASAAAAAAAAERLRHHNRRGSTGESRRQGDQRVFSEWEHRVAALEEQLEHQADTTREAEAKLADALEMAAEERERAEYLTKRLTEMEQENENLRRNQESSGSGARTGGENSEIGAENSGESGGGPSGGRGGPAAERITAELEEAVTLLEVCAERMAAMETALERRRGQVSPEAYSELRALLQLALEEVP